MIAALLLGAANTAQALTLHAGDVVTFNADFTGASPLPPYLFTALQLEFSNTDQFDRVGYAFFSELHQTGTLLGLFPNRQVPLAQTLFGAIPDMMDGVFSIRLPVEQGEFNLDNVWAEAHVDPDGIPDITTAVTLDLPEPTNLVLSGTVAAFATLRRRSAA